MESSLLALIPFGGKSVIIPNHQLLLNPLKVNRGLMIQYIRDAQLPVLNRNPLLKIINTFPTGNAEPLDIWFRCKEIGLRVARGLGFNSAFSKGADMPTAVFKGASEYLTIINSEFPEDTNWEAWEPIKIISHNYTALEADYLINDPKELGEATIGIDLGLLGLQYWYFQQENLHREIPLGPDQFLMGYPLVNSIYSYLEIALFNHFTDTFLGRPVSAFNPNVGPITLRNIKSPLANVANRLQARLIRKDFTLGDYLVNFKLVDYTLLDLFSKGDEEYLTRHNGWVFLLNQLKYCVLIGAIENKYLDDFDSGRRFAVQYRKHLLHLERSGWFRGRDEYVNGRLLDYQQRIDPKG